jgi:hypothetical protein
MKSETNNVVNIQNFENLLKETPETLATNLTQEMLTGKVKNFGIVDLWKIQKARGSAQNRRRAFNSSY